MTTVGAFEAKNKLGALLDLAEEVARPVPPRGKPNREEARAAIRRIRQRAEEAKLGPFDWEEWKAYRDDGRP